MQLAAVQIPSPTIRTDGRTHVLSRSQNSKVEAASLIFSIRARVYAQNIELFSESS